MDHNLSETTVSGRLTSHSYAQMAQSSARDSDGDEKLGNKTSGLTKLKPGSRKNNWKPLLVDWAQSRMEEGLYNVPDDSFTGEPEALPKSLGDLSTSYSLSTATNPFRRGGYEDNQSDIVRHDQHTNEIVRVFGGRLPGQESLQDTSGATNGAVTFVEHPTGDVSAHQWDSDQALWVNIGQYSALRRKIEGSLASDHLRGQTVSNVLSPNTLHYFKAVARQREGIQDPRASRVNGPQMGLSDSHRPKFDWKTDDLISASLSSTNLPTMRSFKGVGMPYSSGVPTGPMRLNWHLSPSGFEEDPFTSSPAHVSHGSASFGLQAQSKAPLVLDRHDCITDFKFPHPPGLQPDLVSSSFSTPERFSRQAQEHQEGDNGSWDVPNHFQAASDYGGARFNQTSSCSFGSGAPLTYSSAPHYEQPVSNRERMLEHLVRLGHGHDTSQAATTESLHERFVTSRPAIEIPQDKPVPYIYAAAPHELRSGLIETPLVTESDKASANGSLHPTVDVKEARMPALPGSAKWVSAVELGKSVFDPEAPPFKWTNLAKHWSSSHPVPNKEANLIPSLLDSGLQAETFMASPHQFDNHRGSYNTSNPRANPTVIEVDQLRGSFEKLSATNTSDLDITPALATVLRTFLSYREGPDGMRGPFAKWGVPAEHLIDRSTTGNHSFFSKPMFPQKELGAIGAERDKAKAFKSGTEEGSKKN